MILITGATGNCGSALLELFRATDHDVACMTHREPAKRDLETKGCNVVLGDFDDRDSLDRALQGVDRAFLVCTPDKNLASREARFIDAARNAGLDRIVLLSGFPCDNTPSPILQLHGEVEAHLAASSGLGYTILRPLGFMQTIYWMSIPSIEKDGVMVGSTGDGRNAVIDLRDVAQVAFKALVEDGHQNKVYDLTGPRALSMAEMAGILGSSLARPIGYLDIPPEHLATGMVHAGVPEIAIEHVLAVFGAIREGRLDMVLDTLSQLGVAPHTFEDFALDIKAQRTGAASSFEPPAGTRQSKA